jgi:hypothetical protein
MKTDTVQLNITLNIEAVRSRFEPGNRLTVDLMGLFKTHINCL